MLKRTVLLVLILGFAGISLAQNDNVLEFHVGYLNPKGVEGGMIYSGKYGIVVDERVDISLGVDFFHSSYTKDETVTLPVATGQTQAQEVMRSIENKAFLIPISLNAKVIFPLQPPVNAYAGAGFSYQMLFNKVENYEDDVSETQRYGGTGWIFRGGIEYELGSRSSLLIEAFYDLAKVSRNLDDSTDGLPRREEVNLGGVGFRAGLRMMLY